MITLKDIKNYIGGNVNKILDEKFNSLPEYVKEQADLRAITCAPCLENGRCFTCGCSTPGMFYAPYKTCPEGKWGEMVDENQWETKKKASEIIDDIVTIIQTENGAIAAINIGNLPDDMPLEEFIKHTDVVGRQKLMSHINKLNNLL